MENVEVEEVEDLRKIPYHVETDKSVLAERRLAGVCIRCQSKSVGRYLICIPCWVSLTSHEVTAYREIFPNKPLL